MASKERRAQDKARQTETYYQAGEAVADEVAEAYLAAYRSLQAEAERVFQSFAGAFSLSQAEARRLLNDYPDADARALLRRAAEAMPEGPEKERALAEISAPAYQYRIRRIETLQDQAEARLAAVARQEAKLAKAHYTRVIGDSYLYGVYDVQRAAGVGFHFHALSDRAVSAMVNARWPKLGITYSEAVWKDTAAIAQRIRQDVVLGVMTGLPARRAMEQIEEDFRVRAYEARRLVRTETARMAAEADKASMEACGIEEYEFCATLDEATCSRCGALDGKRFPAKQGEPGVNMEPLHPNCGCYTVPVVEEFGGRAGTRLARDPESGENVKIPEDMTFEQWKARLQDDGDGGRMFIRRGKQMDDRITSPIESRHTGKGNPSAIIHFDRPLNHRQQRLLAQLPNFDDRVTVGKGEVSLRDLSALTAYSGVEYAMFTRKGERLIIRGNEQMTNIDMEAASKLAREGYRWSGHTHPGDDSLALFASDGDRAILKAFGQEQSVIYNATGKRNVFTSDE